MRSPRRSRIALPAGAPRPLAAAVPDRPHTVRGWCGSLALVGRVRLRCPGFRNFGCVQRPHSPCAGVELPSHCLSTASRGKASLPVYPCRKRPRKMLRSGNVGNTGNPRSSVREIRTQRTAQRVTCVYCARARSARSVTRIHAPVSDRRCIDRRAKVRARRVCAGALARTFDWWDSGPLPSPFARDYRRR